MATTLLSPGVSVSVTDDSSYAAGVSSSIPLFIIGTHKNKTTPSGAIASGTLSENSNKLMNITSQAELVSTFGTPVFYSNEGTPLHGYELNEYGLHAAYQFMASNNECFVLNCAIDYSQLIPNAVAPVGNPVSGTYWLDTSNTTFGIFENTGNGNKVTSWKNSIPTVISSTGKATSVLMGRVGFADKSTTVVQTTATTISINGTTINVPANSTLQMVADAVNTTAITNVTASVVYVAQKYYILLTQSTSSTDLEVDITGTDATFATAVGLFDSTGAAYSSVVQPNNSIGLNGDFAVVTVTNANIVFQKIKSIVANDPNSSTADVLWYPVGSDIWKIAAPKNSLYMGNYGSIPSTSVAGDIWLSTISKANGMNFSVKLYSATTSSWTVLNVNYYASADALPSTATVGNIAVVYGILSGIASYTPYIYKAGAWSQLVYQAGPNTPVTTPPDNTLWYNNVNFVADIMINKNGQEWVGYRNYNGLEATDTNGVIIAGSMPTTQSTGASLVDGDIWLDSSDQENYPSLYRYEVATASWTEIDNTDDYSPYGIIFKDARQDNGNGSTTPYDLLVSNFVDPDAPNPELYPDGLLLLNTRISTNNVKEWKSSYFKKGGYQDVDYTQTGYTVGTATFPALSSAGRWVTISGNAANGSPLMARKSQRSLIVESLIASVSACANILSEDNYYSLVAAPGYIELLSTMENLSISRKSTVFVVGDTPVRLASDATSISAFCNPTSTTLGDTEEGIVTSSSLVGVYYPWGLSTNTDGSSILVPPSTMAMKTIAYSDSISYPWFAPAGYTRGIVTNASSVGYLNSTTGNYVSVILDNGQRDTLYTNNINPIAYMKGQGLVVYGQKTRQGTETALDRINVQRLVCLLVYQLEALAKPFLFENNTEHTRALVTSTFTRFMTNFVTAQGVYDFIVVCDDTNNTASTIDAHELWIDIAIQPVETIEFIYIPLRIVNTGTDMSAIYGTNTTGATS